MSRPQVEFEHYYFAIEAAVNGLGACVVPYHLVADDVRNGRLAAPCGFVESGYRYVARPQQPMSEKAKVFTAWLRREANAIDIATDRRA